MTDCMTTFQRIGRMVPIAVLALTLGPRLQAGGDDVRRDATVQAVAKVLPSVVNISTETVIEYRDPFEDLLREWYGRFYRDPRPNKRVYHSLGSGVIINGKGYILTNNHVVRRATRIGVTFVSDPDKRYEAVPVATLESSDLALLKIQDAENQEFTPVQFAPEDDMLLGETVLALGNPFGLGGSVSKGILSSKTPRILRQTEPLEVEDWLQTDAAINPGNSGGPLIDLNGQLIGVNVAIYREGEGIGFAVPVKRINEALTKMFTPEQVASLWFGANLKLNAGRIEVAAVEEDSPAALAGLKPGDSIDRIGGQPTTDYIDFILQLSDEATDHPVTLSVIRESRAKEILLRLRPERDHFNNQFFQQKIGINAQPLTEDLAREFGYGRAGGLLISDVFRGSAASKRGLEEGMVLTAMDGVAVNDLVSAGRILGKKQSDETVRVTVVYRSGPGGRFLARSEVDLKVQ